MRRLTRPVACDVCHEPTYQIYGQATLLSRDDVFCWFCYCAWYGSGLCTESEIRRESLRQRYDEVHGWA